LVVVARLRAAAVAKLSCGCSPFTFDSNCTDSVTTHTTNL
jgi:hypothetical protein